MAWIQIQRRDDTLRRTVDEDMKVAAERAGAQLACRPGCTECCIGPFPITALDALRLQEGLRRLQRQDPSRAAAVAGRAHRAVDEMAADFPGDATTGALDEDDAAQDAFFERFAGQPCPALDPATGTCDLYEHRPLSCRTYGPPVRLGAEDLPPCRLCFAGAGADTIEACRIEPRVGEEAEILRGMGDPPETVVAFALATAVPEEADGSARRRLTSD